MTRKAGTQTTTIGLRVARLVISHHLTYATCVRHELLLFGMYWLLSVLRFLFVRLRCMGAVGTGNPPYPVLYFSMHTVLVKTESEGYHLKLSSVTVAEVNGY